MSRRVKDLAQSTAAVVPFTGKKPSLIKPWPKEKRDSIADALDVEAKNAARRLKATCCVIVAFFPDGEFYHMQDGGQAPMPTEQLYRHLVAAKEAEASGGEDTHVN